MQPQLTIVMPAHNAQKYISETIESFVNQTFQEWKLIIIDDCSTDDTWKIINSWKEKDNRIDCIQNHENLKVAKTMNKGIAMVDSPYFSRIDSDDVLLPDHFEKILHFLEKNKEIGLCGSQVITIDSESNFRRKWNYETENDWIKISSIYACPFLQSSVIMRTEVIKAVEGYDPKMELIEDYELWIRILQKYKAATLDRYTIKYRIHDNNMSETNKGTILKMLESMYASNQQNYSIDISNLGLHARMEVGAWENLSKKEFENISTWKNNLLEINKIQKKHKPELFKDVLNKNFTNAYLKIASQNGGILKIKALIHAYLGNIKWSIFITKRKFENSKL